MGKISENEVKDILKNKETMLNSIHEKLFMVRHDLMQHREIIEMVCLSSPISGVSGPKGVHKDLSDVYEKYQNTLNRRRTEYKALFRQMVRKEDKINRVWGAFLTLDDPYYWILNELYVHNRLYTDVESCSGMSHRIFEEKRKDGIRQIIRLYESNANISVMLLMKEREKEQNIKKQDEKDQTGAAKSADASDGTQMTLAEFGINNKQEEESC